MTIWPVPLAAGAGCKELSNKVAKMEFDLHHGDGRVQPMFRQLTKNASVEEARLDAGEITWHVIRGSGQLTVAVAGRVTVDSSPNLRCLLLDLLRRGSAQGIVIDLSAVSYLDMSGLATLLEALKAARQLSVTLRVTGVSGEARHLAEIAQLDTIFRAWGSEVEYQ